MINKIKFPNTRQTIGSKSCGPLCLLNIYEYFGLKISLEKILKDLEIDNKTTTYQGQLSKHLLSVGLEVILLSSNPFVNSPSWGDLNSTELIKKLELWLEINKNDKWFKNVKYLLSFLKKGGQLKIVDLTTKIIDKYLNDNYLLIPCLEESWIWGERKIIGTNEFHDIKGTPRGHFIVIYGQDNNNYLVSDPFPTGIKNRDGLYQLNKDKLLIATLVWSGQIIAVKNK